MCPASIREYAAAMCERYGGARKKERGRLLDECCQSTCYYRGRIVAALRELPLGDSLDLLSLGGRVKPDFTAAEANWLAGLVRGLASEGLVEVVEHGKEGEWLVRLG